MSPSPSSATDQPCDLRQAPSPQFPHSSKEERFSPLWGITRCNFISCMEQARLQGQRGPMVSELVWRQGLSSATSSLWVMSLRPYMPQFPHLSNGGNNPALPQGLARINKLERVGGLGATEAPKRRRLADCSGSHQPDEIHRATPENRRGKPGFSVSKHLKSHPASSPESCRK